MDVGAEGEKELQVYSRRHKDKDKGHPTSQPSCQAPSSDPDIDLSSIPPVTFSVALLDDTDVLIAIRKGVRSCT